MAEENRMLIYEMHFSITCSNKTLVQSLLSCQGKKKNKKRKKKTEKRWCFSLSKAKHLFHK